MTRTTNRELDELAAIINRVLEVDDYFIQSAYGQPRLVRAGGSVEVSPRLAKGDLAQWMRAFLAGITAGQSALSNAEVQA